MPVRPIVRLGHPALRTPAEPVDTRRLSDPEIQTPIADMRAPTPPAGGAGVAAPQLGISLQIFVHAVVDPETDEVPGDDGPGLDGPGLDGPELRVLVNPALEPVHGELAYDWEGCLSIPALRGLVPRHPAVRVRGQDRDGRVLDYRAEDDEARILQHEYDHLNGVGFLDRMRDLHSLAFGAEWEEYMTEGDEDGTQDDG